MLQDLADVRRNFGTAAMLRTVVSRASKKLLRLEASETVWLDADRLPPSIVADPNFTFRFLTIDEIDQLAGEEAYELAPEFVSRVAEGMDVCFAALTPDGRVAHYGWYALGSIEGEHHMGVPMSFPDDVAYMYNAFTHPEFRGRRLHGTAMALALKSLADRGITKLLSTVEWTNYASLRSFERLGFERFGRRWTLGGGNCRWGTNSKAARLRGIRFGREALVTPRSREGIHAAAAAGV